MYMHESNHAHDASTSIAPAAPAEPRFYRSALAGRSPTTAGPPGQTQALGREPRPTDGAMRWRLPRAARRRGRSHAARLAAAAANPAAAGGLSLPKGSASLVRQPWGMGRDRRSRRAHQVACREALGAWMAGSERDGPRVLDAATHVESGREEVDRRYPHRGVEPRCLAEAGGRSTHVGLRFRWHPCVAGHSRHRREEVARALLCSLRWPAAGNCRWIAGSI